MKLHLETNIGTYQIQSVDSQSVTINNVVYTHSLILMPSHLEKWAVDSFDHLQVTHIEQLLNLHPDLVLLGTGSRQRFPSPAVLAPLINARIGIEVMDTPAACRTYTILMGDGRAVAAALLFQ